MGSGGGKCGCFYAALEESDMQKHPNEFTRRQILNFFSNRHFEIKVVAVENSYVIFFRRFSFVEACIVEDPAGRLVYDETSGDWTLYWMNGCFHWYPYDRYGRLDQALKAMLEDQAASLFQKVL
jgi:hypothetical protein